MGREMRVLISYEESHRAYSNAVEGVIRGLRPSVEVAAVRPRELESEVERFDPHLVVCSRPNVVDPGRRAAWFRLSPEPDEPSEICLDGQRLERNNPGLDDLLEAIDETEKLIQTGRDLGGC